MADRDITVFYNVHRLDAIEKHLTGNTSVEEIICRELDKLYEQTVPETERVDIDNLIAAEDAERQAFLEASRRFSVIHLHDADHDYHFTSELHTDFFHAARLYRMITKELKGPGSLADRLSKSFMSHQPIDPETFSKLCDSIPYDNRITALMEFDFEDGTVGICRSSDNAWWYYDLKDVSSAVYKAERRTSLRWDDWKKIFESALEGKELDVYGEEECQDETPSPSMQM